MFLQVKEAELSWLDARFVRRPQIFPQATISEEDDWPSEQQQQEAGNDEKDTEVVEVEAMEEASAEAVAEKNQDPEAIVPDQDPEEPMDDSSDALQEQPPSPATRKAAIAVPDQLCLEMLPSSCIPPHQSVFVNDPKLTDLKVISNVFFEN